MSTGSVDFVNQTLLLLHTRQSFSATSKDLFLVSVLSKNLSGYVSGELRGLHLGPLGDLQPNQPGNQPNMANNQPNMKVLPSQRSFPEIVLEFPEEMPTLEPFKKGAASPPPPQSPVSPSTNSSQTSIPKSPLPVEGKHREKERATREQRESRAARERGL